MVHVLDLLGCTAQGPTTESALEAAPPAIGAYLAFLQRHGVAVDPRAGFSTVIAGHVMEGSWLGYGDPAPGFAPDFQPLSVEDLETYLQRMDWMQADLLHLLRDIPPGKLAAQPESGGRSMIGILEHTAESNCVYLRYQVGKVDGLSEALKAVHPQADDLPVALARLWKIIRERLEALTPEERQQRVPHGQVTWTAPRALRRMLEHTWEHVQELSHRVEGNGGIE
jgi:predicted RNase H-like HicB family nuclease